MGQKTEAGEPLTRFQVRRDKALTTIVLAVDPSLLYMIGPDLVDSVAVWKALSDQFQRKMWANKLDLKRKLFSMRLGEGSSMQDHLKAMTEVCDELSQLGSLSMTRIASYIFSIVYLRVIMS